MKMKKFTFEVTWQMHGMKSVEVPADFSISEAIEHVLDNWPNIQIPEGELVADSDEPYFEDCRFEAAAHG